MLVRTHGDGGWTEWTALEPRRRPPTAEGSGRAGTEPLYAGPSDGYQVRVDASQGALPRGLRVDLIDPGSRARTPTLGAGAPMADAPQAAAGMPQIFTRAQWGADERIRRGSPSYTGHDQGRLRAPHRRAPTATPRPRCPRSSAASTRTT